MFAVIRTGSKQYCVKPGDVIKVEKLDNNEGDNVVISDVVLVSGDKGVVAGRNVSDKMKVEAKVLKQVRNDKIIVFKKIRRHNYRRKNGHRQPMTLLQISNIVA